LHRLASTYALRVPAPEDKNGPQAEACGPGHDRRVARDQYERTN
jgi:hypothetical protein